MVTELPKHYEPAAIEQPVYDRWLADKSFAASPDDRQQPYVIMMPLPNVTGALHMGHAMDNVMQDMLVRWHRMMGRNALWMAGTDHAGIATQMLVTEQLAAQGIKPSDLGRESFVDKVWEWKEESGGTISKQLRRLGASLHWETER